MTFEGWYGWDQKKNILQTNFEGKKILARNYLMKNNSYTGKKYFSWFIMLKKNLTPLYVSKKLYNHPYTAPLPDPPSFSNGPAPINTPINVNPVGVGGKCGQGEGI